MTVLALSATIRLGNLRYDTHALSVETDLQLLPASNQVRCRLPASVPVEARGGDEAEVTLANGEQEAKILTGMVTSVSRSFTATDVTAVDGAALLARGRPADTFQSKAPGDILRSLAEAAGAPVGRITLNPEPFPYYAATQQRTATEHVANLAALGGGLAAIDGEGRLNAFLRPLPPAEAALRYGRELLDLQVIEDEVQSDVALIGAGAAASAGDPRALQPTVRALSGDAGEASINLVWQSFPALRTPASREAAAQEASARRSAQARRLVANCWLQPQLRPGMLIEIQGLPDRLAGGTVLLTGVSHRLARRGGFTRFEGVSGEPGAGSLLEALGGLL